jgi:hypothetical protein
MRMDRCRESCWAASRRMAVEPLQTASKILAARRESFPIWPSPERIVWEQTAAALLQSTDCRFGQVQLIGFDNGDSITGFALPQTSSLSLSALTGNWSFFLSGSSGSTTIADAGRFTLDSREYHTRSRGPE